MFITIDLEAMYDKISTMHVDVRAVRTGIYNVLDRNHIKHAENLKDVMNFNVDFDASFDNIHTKKATFTHYLSKLEDMLTDATKCERDTLRKLEELVQFYENSTSIQSIHKDVQKTKQLEKINQELISIRSTKQDIIFNYLNMKDKREDLSLQLDKIYCDNIIMMDTVLDNLKTLAKIK